MSSNIVKQFRGIFDQQMMQDGYIWKHNMYMHICFSQGWYAETHVCSYASGYEFKVVCSVGLLPMLTTDELKSYHLYQEPSIGLKYDCFANLPAALQPEAWRIIGDYPEHYYTLPSTDAFFQYTLERYRVTVKPMIQSIQDLYDAYLFMRQTESLPMVEYSFEKVHLLIDALVSVHHSTDAISLINDLRNEVWRRRNTISELLRTTEAKLHEVAQIELSQRQKSDQIRCALLEQNMKGMQNDLEKKQAAFDQLDEIEASIRSGKAADRTAAFLKLMDTSSARLLRSFTREERERMANNWRR